MPAQPGDARRRTRGGEPMRVRREGRADDDGFRSELVPGVRASGDAERLATEIGFACGRLAALAVHPPGLYGEAQAAAPTDIEGATWICFLTAYLCPLQDPEDPFAGIREVLAAMPNATAPVVESVLVGAHAAAQGPRTSHDVGRGASTLVAYRQWVARGGGGAAPSGDGAAATQAAAFEGDTAWTPARRFERVFERLALPGLGRMGRYELLVTLGRLGCYDMRPDSLQLAGARGAGGEEPTIVAAKRVFGIGDPLLLERRAAALADAAQIPIEALDLALGNWAAPERTTLGFPGETADEDARERALAALGM